jgi:NADP-dependent alcohol dehydrogenase
MQNFDFQNGTRIVFGANRLDDLQRLIPSNAKVLMLYGGGSIKKNGIYQEIVAQLQSRDWSEFGGVESNPSMEQLEPVIAQAKEKKIDFILAVGGGSVVDASKFVAAAAKYEGEPWDILASRGKKVKAAIPIGVFLTLPATGSESNIHSVITRKQWKVKATFSSNHVSPKFAMLDPSVMASLPVRQLGNGVVDAFVHVMEQYLTVPANAPVQDRFAEGLLQTLIEIGPQVVANPGDLQLSGNLMWTAGMALNGLIGVGVPQDWSTHAIGHELTALYNLDHAQTLAVVLPAMMHLRREVKQQKLLQYAERVWGLKPDGSSDDAVQACITAVIERTQAFFESVGVKTRLSDYQLGANVIPVVIKQLEAHGITEMGEDKGVTLEVARQVLERAL